MLGVSLPYPWLTEGAELPAAPHKLLPVLYDRGVRSVEIRAVYYNADPDTVLHIFELLWAHGFTVTVHGMVRSLETAVEDVFAPLAKAIAHLRQDALTVTIHPLDTDNVPILTALADHIDANGYPVAIALENNRLLPNKQEGNSVALVLDAVRRVNRKNIGICFDFGHYTYYRLKNLPDEPFILPDADFFRYVIHTHIHALRNFTTHFPIDRDILPLREILAGLDFGYYGIYNLELDFPRLTEDPVDALLCSVDTLRDAMPFCARMYDDLRQNFDRWFADTAAILTESSVGTRFGLLHATSYLFSTNGYAWGMDIAFRHAYELAKSPARAAQMLRPLKLIIISHSHGDHFEEETVRALAENDTTWVIPDFLVEEALSYGIRADRMHIAHADTPMTIGPLTILPFAGRHYRPGTQNGVPEYGYYITSPDAPSLVFPGDTRDYSLSGLADLPKADYCFAHVWLGDGNCLDTDFPLAKDFAAFMLHFSDQHIFFTHLYENGRMEPYIWTPRHASLLADEIHALSPDTETIIPDPGSIFTL